MQQATLQKLVIGEPRPFGRERVVYALPFDNGNNRIPGHQYQAPQLLVDSHANALAAPDGTAIGVDGIWIPRMLVARWVEDTRRLGG